MSGTPTAGVAGPRMRATLLAALAAAAAGWKAGAPATTRAHWEGVAAAPGLAAPALLPSLLLPRPQPLSSARARVHMCSAVASIEPIEPRKRLFRSGFGLRNKARLLRRSWVIWSCCVLQAWKVLNLRRVYRTAPKLTKRAIPATSGSFQNSLRASASRSSRRPACRADSG